MRETEIVDVIRKLAGTHGNSKALIRGIGDDCALLRPSRNEDLVFTTDFVLEGRHFTLDTHRAADVGHKALARSLSDLAAMGSQPVFCLVSLALPEALTGRWLKGFYGGLLALANRYGVSLAGGDLSRFDKVVVDVMCCGRVQKGKALLRSGAKPGDAIYVTGELGGSALGLATRRGKAWKRHLRPEPRLGVGLALAELGVTACLDLSDGLSLDLARLCKESNVSADLDGTLPTATGATLKQALDGGEDYELLFTAAPKRKLPNELRGVRITRIGLIAKGKGDQIRLAGTPLKTGGFDHFGFVP